MGDTRRCRTCLQSKMPDTEYYNNMHAYIENMDEHIKSPSGLYNERLEICKTCESLLNGMCRICGCFVEMRAAVNKNYCPGPGKRW